MTVNYNSGVFTLKKESSLNCIEGYIYIFIWFICRFKIVKKHLCPFLDFLYHEFTLILLKAKYHEKEH